MNKLIAFFFLTFILLTSCTSELTPPFTNTGKIIGYDYRLCACCGGFFVEIEGDTLRSQVWPQGFNLDPRKEGFPLEVRLVWEPEADPCLGDEIEVYSMERLKK